MHSNNSGLFNSRIIIAIFIILIGALLLAKNLGMEIPFDAWELWPLLLIFVGVGHLIRPPRSRQPVSGIILILLGFIFLGNTLGWFYFNFSQLWPVFLIFVGLAMIGKRSWKVADETIDTESIDLSMILGGGEYRYTSRQLRAGKISAIMGGGTIDLSETEMSGNELIMHISILMGGLEVIIPKHWEVHQQNTPILGGVEDKTRGHRQNSNDDFSSQGNKRLVVQGSIILGGLEIRN